MKPSKKQIKNAHKLILYFKKTTKSDGVLNYEKDVEQKLSERLNSGLFSSQEQIKKYFDEKYPVWVLDRLRSMFNGGK